MQGWRGLASGGPVPPGLPSRSAQQTVVCLAGLLVLSRTSLHSEPRYCYLPPQDLLTRSHVLVSAVAVL